MQQDRNYKETPLLSFVKAISCSNWECKEMVIYSVLKGNLSRLPLLNSPSENASCLAFLLPNSQVRVLWVGTGMQILKAEL